MEVLAIIPARGGSKGLPNKNILPLLGHPLIAYSIKAALDAALVTRVIVSTDSQAIADVALKYGAEVPFMRPLEYAQDLSTDIEVFVHALDWLKKHEHYSPDFVIQLRPTSPVREVSVIDKCIQKMIDFPEADSLRIITPSPITPYKMWTLDERGETPLMRPLLEVPGVKEPYNEPRQRLPQTFWQIGTLDVIKPEVILNGSMSGQKILPHVVESTYAVDIDDLASFKKAEEVILSQSCVTFDNEN